MEREEVKKLLESFVPLMRVFADTNPFQRISFPTGPDTSCKIEFDGPVGIDDMDVVLAHIAFYKTIMPTEKDDLITRSHLDSRIEETLNIKFPAPDAKAGD